MEDNEVEKCPECGSEEFKEKPERGELICSECGLVINDNMVDSSPEWRAFNEEETKDKSRAGPSLTYKRHDMGLSTDMGKGSSKMYEASSENKNKYRRLRMWHKRITDSHNKNLKFSLSELNRLVSALRLPDSVHEEIARMYDKIQKKGLTKGRKKEGLVCGLIYVYSRKQGSPRTLKELADISNISKREIGKDYRYLCRELNIDINPARPEDFIPRYAEKLQLSGETQARAIELAKKARKNYNFSGKAPSGIAGAVLYIASHNKGEGRTQKEISNVINTSKVTIRNTKEEIVEVFDEVEDPKAS